MRASVANDSRNSSGVGFLIMDARQLSQTDVVLAGIITMGLLGKLTDDGSCYWNGALSLGEAHLSATKNHDCL